jgi:hypothetical protein
MEDVDEHADVYGIVGEWKRVAIEGMAFDYATWARQDFHAFDGNVWALLGD